MRRMIRNIMLLLLGVLFMASCATTTTTASFLEGNSDGKNYPKVIAAMPPINKTVNVEVKEFLYCTFTRPLAERGYYVLPSFLTMEMFKSESAYDSELFIDGNLKKFGEVLGADALLFTIIHRWEKAALLAQITVEVEYILKSTHDNSTLFTQRKTIVHNYSSGSTSGGLTELLVGMAIDALVTASKDPIEAARQANNLSLSNLPAGIYHPDYERDRVANTAN